MMEFFLTKNMVHVVINNGAHETVGGMPTVAGKIDLVGMCRYGDYMKPIHEPNMHDGIFLDPDIPVDNFEDLDRELLAAKKREALSFIEVKSAIGAYASALRRPRQYTRLLYLAYEGQPQGQWKNCAP